MKIQFLISMSFSLEHPHQFILNSLPDFCLLRLKYSFTTKATAADDQMGNCDFFLFVNSHGTLNKYQSSFNLGPT